MRHLTAITLASLFVCVTFLGATAAEQALSVAPMPDQLARVRPASLYTDPPVADAQETADCVSCGDDCCGISCCRDCCCGPRWLVSADLLFMTRSTADPRPLASEGGATLMSTSDLDVDSDGGFAVQLTRATRYGWDLDVGFSTVEWWSGPRTVTGTGLFAPGAYGVAFGGGTSVSADYGTSLYSTEINLRKQTCSWLTPFFGFRWVELHERFLLAMPTTGGGFSPGIVQGTNADNHLYGFQLGANGLLFNRGRLRLETVLKAGIYGNQADHNSYAFVEGTGYIRDVRGATSRTAFVGEFQLAGKYQISDCLAARLGYQLMWLDGVALAPNQFYSQQLDATTATVDTSATAFYHGVFVGLELRR